MADLIDKAHADVGLNLLIANPALGPTRVFDGVVPDPTPNPPYLLVYTVIEWTRDGVGTALDALQDTVTTSYYCHAVGLTAAAARAMQMQARSSLLNVRPVIAGRNCSPIKQRETVPPQRDETTGRLVMDAVAVYDYQSTG